MSISLPIIIEEPGTVILYSSLADAELNLEAIDVDNGTYRGYDSEGRLLDISTDAQEVVISTLETHPCHAQELEIILREHLFDVGKDIDRKNLAELVEEAKIFQFIHPGSGWQVFKIFIKDLVDDIWRRFK